MGRGDNAHRMLRFVWLLVPTITVLGKAIPNSTFENTTTGNGPHTDPSNTVNVNSFGDFSVRLRHNRGVLVVPSSSPSPSPSSSSSTVTTTTTKTRRNRGVNPNMIIYGMSFESSNDKRKITYDTTGRAVIMEADSLIIWLFGNFIPRKPTNPVYFSFTKVNKTDAGACNEQHSTVYRPVQFEDQHVGRVNLTLPSKADFPGVLYVCLKEANQMAECQGIYPWLTIEMDSKLLPMWLQIMFIVLLLILSGLFSGLNLGLMSLNKTDLKIIINTGTTEEKTHAAKIAPVRNHGNFLLCCLLFSNVLVNTTLTILMEDFTSGPVAIIGSTMAIVMFGEIIPQAICSRHGLAVGAKTICITKFFMLITFPLAYPLSKVLDRFLGEEIGSVYTRERLKELLRVTKDHHGLENEEVGIISGALDMKNKTVKDVMTKLDCVYMLPSDAVLTFDTMADIEYHGYSRIPIYERERSNIVALLNVKQLTLLDANDKIPIRTVVDFYQNQLFYVFENTRLDYIFRAFREGNRGHMAFVQKVNDEGPGDPYYETIGVVTMEDVLEELLQAEIMDESDVGKLQARRPNSERPKDAPYMLHKKFKSAVQIPPSLGLAAVQFLSASVEPFKKDHITVGIISRLMKTAVVFVKGPKLKHNEQQPVFSYIYEQGKPSEYFVMILEGRVQVVVGKESMTFEGGPFTCFGSDFLMSDQGYDVLNSYNSQKLDLPDLQVTTIVPPPTEGEKKRVIQFNPDYTVKVLTDVTYFRLKYTAYKAAKLASELETNYKDPAKAAANSNWEAEIEKVLIEVDEDVNND